jgi:hypothetical protein
MNLEKLSDESVAHYCENIRQRAQADRAHKRHFTASATVRQSAEQLRHEMIKRKIQHPPSAGPPSVSQFFTDLSNGCSLWASALQQRLSRWSHSS